VVAATDVRRILSLIASLPGARRSMKRQKSDDTGDNGERVDWMLPPQRVSVPHPPSIYRFERLPGTGRALPLRKPSRSAILNLE
jgi:hypothetical protein